MPLRAIYTAVIIWAPRPKKNNMPQLPLPLSLPAIFAEDNFIVSACNEEAHRWIGAHRASFILYGPAGSGKTHLGHIWAARHHAHICNTLPAPDMLTADACIENIERFRDERTLFHLLNNAKENGHTLLLTTALPPKQLPFTLPDLTSRLLAMPAVAIHMPDDDALRGALRKQFADRQLKITGEAIDYILPRIERSFAQAQAWVELLDQKAMAEKKPITIPFIRHALE